MNCFFFPIHLLSPIPFLCGWILDRLWGDPPHLPHPIVAFGRLISSGEKILNKGKNRYWKGLLLTFVLVAGTFAFFFILLKAAGRIHPLFSSALVALGVFFGLGGKTLITEVRLVFEAVDRDPDEGRKQLSRIVGRDTSSLSPQEIRVAALETLAENLSDGVIAPMFWFALLGLPGMMAYKMVNTLDSMIGYKNKRYLEFGKAAAKLDDVANYLPARLTAYGMLLVSGNWKLHKFIRRFARAHTSPNSGYPEAALAGILDCRFGGTHYYFGKPVEKPYIGTNERAITIKDMQIAVRINNLTELAMGFITCLILLYR
ncbi:adenosylcobinamide-phosphate synthase CbiB [Parabacteroides sp. Marseille-P3160]|uniref:adenosylcobinamide-phosphate synthase CbiB n=1 Tax=Parabacteroides sp. Marseille-P3160 TaxID=1917887 RepID=UPI0009BB4AAA|nr:adenosylcobinamide-phosphate synthase CbiB [Parabacteroides sp. Marseille-P3160]